MWFSPEFRRHFRQSIEMFVLTAVVMAFAIALTYVEDWCDEHHRPHYVGAIIGFLAAAVAVADGIVILGICVKVICHAGRDIFTHVKHPPK